MWFILCILHFYELSTIDREIMDADKVKLVEIHLFASNIECIKCCYFIYFFRNQAFIYSSLLFTLVFPIFVGSCLYSLLILQTLSPAIRPQLCIFGLNVSRIGYNCKCMSFSCIFRPHVVILFWALAAASWKSATDHTIKFPFFLS